MIRVGITGGIGSGKSTVAKAFQVLGAPVFDADHAGKRALNEDPELQESLKKAFGDRIYGPKGLDRKALASIVFQDEKKLKQLNALVHPKVRERFDEWCVSHRDAPYVIEEAAILIESGGYELLDVLILVTAPEELRIQRVVERDGVGEEQVRQRMKQQWSDEGKRPYADIILPNDDSELLLPRILEWDRGWREGGG